MARVTAQQWIDKWSTNLGNSTQYIKNGVARVTVAPSTSAIAAQDRMKTNLNAAIDSGAWAKGLSKVSLQSWQNSMTTKGINNLSGGIAAAKTTIAPAITQLLSAVDTATAAANQLPKGGLEQGIARANAFMRSMSANAPSKQGS